MSHLYLDGCWTINVLWTINISGALICTELTRKVGTNNGLSSLKFDRYSAFSNKVYSSKATVFSTMYIKKMEQYFVYFYFAQNIRWIKKEEYGAADVWGMQIIWCLFCCEVQLFYHCSLKPTILGKHVKYYSNDIKSSLQFITDLCSCVKNQTVKPVTLQISWTRCPPEFHLMHIWNLTRRLNKCKLHTVWWRSPKTMPELRLQNTWGCMCLTQQQNSVQLRKQSLYIHKQAMLHVAHTHTTTDCVTIGNTVQHCCRQNHTNENTLQTYILNTAISFVTVFIFLSHLL